DLAHDDAGYVTVLQQFQHAQHSLAAGDRATADAQVVVDDDDALGREAGARWDLAELVLLLRRDDVITHLARRGLAEVDDGDLRGVERTVFAHGWAPFASWIAASRSAGPMIRRLIARTSAGSACALRGARTIVPRGSSWSGAILRVRCWDVKPGALRSR